MILYEVFDVNHKDTVFLAPQSIYALIAANHEKFKTDTEDGKLPYETEIRAGQITVFSSKTVAQIRQELEDIEELQIKEMVKKELGAIDE